MSTATALRPLEGIHVPTITIFKDTPGQEIDIEANKKHMLYLAQAGVQGVLIQGSTGEQVALTREERIQLTRATRQVAEENGFDRFTIMAGAGAQSAHEAIALAKDAADAGADYVVVLPPSFFASSMTADAVEAFYIEVADNIPIPLIVYSWPAVSSGLEVTSDGVSRLAKHANIIGIKQTDNNVGKMARNVYQNPGFIVLGGASDYLIGALAVGAHGTITGIANFFPRTILELVALYRAGKHEEATKLQGAVSAAEWAILAGGIPATKYATQLYLGYGGLLRRPVPPAPVSVRERVKVLMAPISATEQKLVARSKGQ
ncbi:dihydrodipicolinate synthetase family protein [Hysterangium stoloniferum]|nr:dihydrodipicolinate synthetase family protein [Hysterangium stoloniferum]